MPTYLALINFTEQGLQNIVDTRRRAEDFRARAKQAGVNVREVLWTMGQYDGALIMEGPDDETVTAVMLGLAALGNVRTRTLRAFDAAEMEILLNKAGGGGAGASASSGGNGGSRAGGASKRGRR